MAPRVLAAAAVRSAAGQASRKFASTAVSTASLAPGKSVAEIKADAASEASDAVRPTAGTVCLSGCALHAAVTHQCVKRGLAAAEGNEVFHGATACAAADHFIEPPFTHGRIKEPFLFKGAEGVSGKHFSPLVAVVARGVAPGKDMREALGEPVKGNGRGDGNFLSSSPQAMNRIN